MEEEILFLDTCSLLDGGEKLYNLGYNIMISSVSLEEIESIKTSGRKDEQTKAKARAAARLIDAGKCLIYNKEPIHINNYVAVTTLPPLEIIGTNDAKIILTMQEFERKNPDIKVIFVSEDLNCRNLAKTYGNFKEKVSKLSDFLNDSISYTGYKEFILTDEEIQQVYDGTTDLFDDILINEYVLIFDESERIVDYFVKREGNSIERIEYKDMNTRHFGKTKPKDIYQKMAIDSLKNNKITVIRGAAGTGKSWLAMNALFEKLEKNEIDTIIVFCNTVATMGAARLGFYPGTKDEKLLDSQIGNFLSSKLGAEEEVLKLISRHQLVLLPMSDIRGFDTTGMNAGVYITEAQNLDINLLKLALQRIGEDCYCVIEGDDDTQVDMNIYAGLNNGMKRMSQVFRGDPCYGEVKLKNIYRSHIADLAEEM